MSSHEEEQEPHPQGPPSQKEMSRRQFLTYTLGGATAFMGAGAVLPMIRFAVDPILHKKARVNSSKLRKPLKLPMNRRSLRLS